MERKFIGNDMIYYENDKNVIVLRSILFFHSEQKTTLEIIRGYFTDYAISKLVNDNFIKIIN